MAIDSAERRKSVSGIVLLLPGVTPNASPDADWRKEAGWSYAGASAGPPAPAVTANDTKSMIVTVGRLM